MKESAADLWTWDDFHQLLPASLSRRTFERMSLDGQAPPHTRFSPHGPPHYNKRAILDWIENRRLAVEAEYQAARERQRREKLTPKTRSRR